MGRVEQLTETITKSALHNPREVGRTSWAVSMKLSFPDTATPWFATQKRCRAPLATAVQNVKRSPAGPTDCVAILDCAGKRREDRSASDDGAFAPRLPLRYSRLGIVLMLL